MTVRILRTDGLGDFAGYEKYLPLLPKKRREKTARLIKDGDKLTSLMTGLMIKRCLYDDFGEKIAEAELDTAPQGKPFVVGHPECQFSVSHSHERIAFVSDSAPIGVDIEKIAKARLNIARRFFTDAEYSRIISSESPDEEFFLTWTKKEAYIKMLGTGLKTPLSSFDTAGGGLEIQSVVEDGYAISVCRSGGGDFAIEYISADRLFGLSDVLVNTIPTE